MKKRDACNSSYHEECLLFVLIEYSAWCDTINLEGPTVYIEGSQVIMYVRLWRSVLS